MKKIFVILIGVFVVALLALAGFFIFKAIKQKPPTVSPQEVQAKVISFFETFYSQMGKPEILSVVPENNLYAINIKIQGQQTKMFATQDGKYFFPMVVDFAEVEKMKKEMAKNATPQEIKKREKPEVKLFVMSHCPFGLQAQKALLPVWELLKEKADIGIYFVDYVMHGKEETEENLRQYCIQKEQQEKYLTYLKCFVKEGKAEECQKKVGVDEQKLKTCVKNTDKEFKISEQFTESGYPPFNVHKDLNEKYQVRGSPTLVINDTVVNFERSPEKIKELICQGFLNPPKECEQKLSPEVPSPGFGEGKSPSGGGQCR